MRLRVRHETVYRYRQPVGLTDHRLLLFPRLTPDVTPFGTTLTIDPEPRLHWSEDAAGNRVAIAVFDRPAETLSILAEHEVRHEAEPYPVFRIDPAAHCYPFTYAPADMALFGPALLNPGPDAPVVAEWTRGVLAGVPDDTLTILNAVNEAAGRVATYQAREAEGTQAPADTLRLASGSCRDLAALFLAAVRGLGFAARAVSGYLHDPAGDLGAAGATHAWCDVFLPGAGWVAFDPTRRRTGAADLIAAAVGTASDDILPVTGGFVGDSADALSMTVQVTVETI